MVRFLFQVLNGFLFQLCGKVIMKSKIYYIWRFRSPVRAGKTIKSAPGKHRRRTGQVKIRVLLISKWDAHARTICERWGGGEWARSGSYADFFRNGCYAGYVNSQKHCSHVIQTQARKLCGMHSNFCAVYSWKVCTPKLENTKWTYRFLLS